MKSLEELKKLREATNDKLDLSKKANGYRVVVGLATCGIAAGAQPVYDRLVEAVRERGLNNVEVTEVGCIGECALEPVVEVYDQLGNRTTYGRVKVADVDTIIEKHLIGGEVITTKLLENLKAK